MDSKQRFSDRVDNYVKYRPSYPAEAIDYLYETVGFNKASAIADVGAGTGIFSRLLLERGSEVYALEPNLEMREAAESLLGGDPRFHSRAGSAEETGLPDGSVGAIVCAQAFHWFDREAAGREFRRILTPGGKVALVWNSRLTEGSEFLLAYDRLLHELGTDYAQINHKNISPVTLHAFFREGRFTEAKFPNSQRFDFGGLKGRLLSSSYVPAPGHPNHEPILAGLRDIFDKYNVAGEVSFDYETEIYWGEV